MAMLASVALAGVPPAADALTISPPTGTPDASPASQISFLGVRAGAISSVAVVGSRSGMHRGRLEAYASAPGASFVPSQPFTQGESVVLTARVAGKLVRSSFSVARVAPLGPERRPNPPAGTAFRSFASAPAIHPPRVEVNVDSPLATPGDVFLTPSHGPGQHGPMIIDGAGHLVWFQPAPVGQIAANLHVAHYQGRPVLVWWQGRVVSPGFGSGVDEVYSAGYQPVARIAAGNGYMADLHDLQLTPQGSAFITAYSAVRADLSSAGGSSHGSVLDAIVEEIDIQTGLVMFEWHALARVPLIDSYQPIPRTREPWDYFHINSISLDPWGDGNLLISSRNTWSAYEISTHTGAIQWRIGGKRPSFRMGSGTGMAWQHDVRWQADHTLTLFDDGAVPKVHSQSRVIRERIDWSHHTVALVGRYVHTPAVLAGSQGSEQLESDGDSFVGWGEQPFLTEYAPDHQVLFEARLPPTGESYRAYRLPWQGQPAAPPAISVSDAGPGSETVYASWNGATNVHAWRIFAGLSATDLAAVATTPTSGFQTATQIDTRAPWVAAQALAADGSILGTSRAARR